MNKILLVNLPEEIGIEMFSFLSINDLCNHVSLVCQQWNEWVNLDSFWKNLYRRENLKRAYNSCEGSFSRFSICPQHDNEDLFFLRTSFEIKQFNSLQIQKSWKQMFKNLHELRNDITRVYSYVIRPYWSIEDNLSENLAMNQEQQSEKEHISKNSNQHKTKTIEVPTSNRVKTPSKTLVSTSPTHKIYKLEGHTDAVKSISPITKNIAVTGSADHTLKFWQLTNAHNYSSNNFFSNNNNISDGLISSIQLPDDPSSIATALPELDPKFLIDSKTNNNNNNNNNNNIRFDLEEEEKDNFDNANENNHLLDNIITVAGLWNGDITVHRGIKPSSSLDEDSSHYSLLQNHQDRVTTIRISRNGTRCISGAFDCSLCVWDIEAERELSVVKDAHNDYVASSLLIDHCQPDGGNLVLTSSRDKTVRLWDLRSCDNNSQGRKGLVHQWRNESGVYRCDVGYHHNQIAFGTYKGMLNVADLRTLANNDYYKQKSLLLKKHTHSGRITCLQWSGASMHGNYYYEYMANRGGNDDAEDVIVTGGKDSAVKLTQAFSGNMIHSYEGFVGPPAFVNYMSQSTAVFTGSNDGTLRTWNPLDGGIINVYELDSDVVCSLAMPLPHVLIGFGNGHLYQIDYEKG